MKNHVITTSCVDMIFTCKIANTYYWYTAKGILHFLYELWIFTLSYVLINVLLDDVNRVLHFPTSSKADKTNECHQLPIPPWSVDILKHYRHNFHLALEDFLPHFFLLISIPERHWASCIICQLVWEMRKAHFLLGGEEGLSQYPPLWFGAPFEAPPSPTHPVRLFLSINHFEGGEGRRKQPRQSVLTQELLSSAQKNIGKRSRKS